LKFHSKLPDDEVNVTKGSAIGELTWMLGGISLFVLVVYFTLGIAIEYGVKKISVEKEQKIFAFLHLDSLKDKDKDERSEAIKLQNLITLSQECVKSSYDFHITISDSNESNAFAVPGGLIVVTQGLLDGARSENELFFVLAHEIGHFQNRDHLEGIGRGLVGLALASMLGISDAGDILETSLNFSESKFSQNRESDADLYAVDLMQCYYGHANGATSFFKKLPQDDGYGFFSSHPKSLKRIELIEEHIKAHEYVKKN